MKYQNEKYQVKEYIDQKNYQPALEILMEILDEDPNDKEALFLFGAIAVAQDKKGLAYNLYARAAKLAPDNPSVWINYGRCQADNEEGWKASEWCFKQALELDSQNVAAMANLAALNVQRCTIKEAKIWAKRALKIQPDYKTALGTLAFAYLMEGKWEKGWNHYRAMMGTTYRQVVEYNDYPIWDGTKGETVIVYGEQGIGDEILFSSMLPDMAKDCTVIYDTMPRLAGLMQRSFPNVHVIGGRWEPTIRLPEGVQPTARIPAAEVPCFYRNKESDFPGTPYLKADPGMRLAMRGLLDSLGDKPKIGIAWTGGRKQTRGYHRTQTLEGLTALLRNDVTWVSLQYKDPSDEIDAYEKDRGIKIHHFPWVTEIKDYDLTAALVAELDLIIAVPTSVTQLAGALGKEAWVMVPKTTGWLFYRDTYPWAKSLKLYHNWTAKQLGQDLEARYANQSKEDEGFEETVRSQEG